MLQGRKKQILHTDDIYLVPHAGYDGQNHRFGLNVMAENIWLWVNITAWPTEVT